MLTWAIITMFFGFCENVGEGVIPLDMAHDSVDDMYDGCKSEMEEKVRAEFLKLERSRNTDFKLGWDKALKTYSEKGAWDGHPLNKEQIMAIYAYTFETPRIYRNFNAAMRTGRTNYTSTFGYHTLLFFLTTAIQTLNSLQRRAKGCHVGFRRVNLHFDQNVLNREIRFGSFTSSSGGEYSDEAFYGNKSCFEIRTCFGADITAYAAFGEAEEEILIPPYEVFNVTSVQTSRAERKLECDVVYKVTSTRSLSNLNCALFAMANLGTCEDATGGVIPLDMANNTVDDMYVGCENKMRKKVENEFLKKEMSKDSDMKQAWEEALRVYVRKWLDTGAEDNQPLRKEEIMALYVFTLKSPNIFKCFNHAVRTSRNEYTTSFNYHTLHFYITTAMRGLNSIQRRTRGCQRTYWRDNHDYSVNVLKQNVRLGKFISALVLDEHESASYFSGHKSCFVIYTCHSVDISVYSSRPFRGGVEKVVIPPYEVFSVENLWTKKEDPKLMCNALYRLLSQKTHSNLNCTLVGP